MYYTKKLYIHVQRNIYIYQHLIKIKAMNSKDRKRGLRKGLEGE